MKSIIYQNVEKKREKAKSTTNMHLKLLSKQPYDPSLTLASTIYSNKFTNLYSRGPIAGGFVSFAQCKYGRLAV